MRRAVDCHRCANSTTRVIGSWCVGVNELFFSAFRFLNINIISIYFFSIPHTHDISIVPKASVRAADKAVVFAADIESASCDVANMVVPYLVCAGKRPAIMGAMTKVWNASSLSDKFVCVCVCVCVCECVVFSVITCCDYFSGFSVRMIFSALAKQFFSMFFVGL